MTCSASLALSFAALPAYTLSAALGQVSLHREGQVVSTISVLPSPLTGKFLGFQASTLQWLDPPSATSSLSSPSPGTLRLENSGTVLSEFAFLPAPVTNRVLSFDGTSLVWRVETGGTGGTADGNDYVNSASVSAGVLSLGRTDSATVTADFTGSFYQKSETMSAFDIHLAISVAVLSAVTGFASLAAHNALDARVTALEATVAAQQATLATLAAQYVALEGTVDSEAQVVTALEARVLALENSSATQTSNGLHYPATALSKNTGTHES